jgi:hypothetical protein
LTSGPQILSLSYGYHPIGTGNAVAGIQTSRAIRGGVTNPMLGPLAKNGGPTMTHALLPGSPAIDAGDSAAVAGAGDLPLFDQRGEPFTRVFDGDDTGGARTDIGTLESQPIPPAVFGDYNQNGVVDAADYVIWWKTLGTTVVPPYFGADRSGELVV